MLRIGWPQVSSCPRATRPGPARRTTRNPTPGSCWPGYAFGPKLCGTRPRARHTVERTFMHMTHVSGGNLNPHGVSRRFSSIGTDPGRIVFLTNLPETPFSEVLSSHLPRAQPNKHGNRSAGLLRCTDPRQRQTRREAGTQSHDPLARLERQSGCRKEIDAIGNTRTREYDRFGGTGRFPSGTSGPRRPRVAVRRAREAR
jgi:hypothetical protein